MSDQSIPTVIKDTPIPLITDSTGSTPSISSGENGYYTPTVIPDTPLPQKVIANQVISDSIDTSTRQILGNYGFGQLGAIAIGKYQQGVSGDVKISPSGIIARNNAGLAYFTLANNGITLTDGSDATILDAQGIRSTSQFLNGQIVSGTTITTTSTSYVDVPGSSFTITINSRPVNIFFNIFVYISNSSGITNANTTSVRMYDSFLGGELIGELTTWGNAATDVYFVGPSTFVNENIATQAVSVDSILTFGIGTHNLKLQYKADGGGTATLSSFIINYLVLGT